MKTVRPDMLQEFFQALTDEFDVKVPVLTAEGERVFGSPLDGPVALAGGALAAKPTTVFFPQEEQVVIFGPDEPMQSPSAEKPLFAAGFTPQDLLCLNFIDRFFSVGHRDDIYFRRRDGAVVAAVSGFSGVNGKFVPLSGGGCDLEFVFDGTVWIVVPYSPAGRRIVAQIPDDAPDSALAAMLEKSGEFVDQDAEIIKAASQLIVNEKVPDSFWDRVAESCIQCTGCNLVCPTCTCFGVQDWRYAARVERSRIWDSCQLEGFMREASGHNPLGTEGSRTRRRIHHKLAADRTKWGEISCFLCGRCDATCPTGIGIVSVSRMIVALFGDRAVKAAHR
jgi:sulfhydrogenase subunit beta (sulfur reductase)